MFDDICYGATVILVGYVALWLSGCHLPGTSRRPFCGWLFAGHASGDGHPRFDDGDRPIDA